MPAFFSTPIVSVEPDLASSDKEKILRQ